MIKPRKGYCVDCNDSKEVYLAKRYPPLCKYHNEKRKAAEKKAKGKTGYRYVKKATGEAEVFKLIWETREHICTNCKDYLGEEARAHYFAHIIPKSREPRLRLEPTNIRLLCMECHRLFDHGTKDKFNARHKD